MVNNPNRLTLNNPVSEMGMSELWMNNCFAKNNHFVEDNWAMYRDFDGEYDLRQFIKRIAEDMGVEIAIDYDDEDFCDMLFNWLEDGLDSKTGLIGFLYHMMTSKTELYEKLKRYEDAEEAGLLLTAPCKPGDDVYRARFMNGRYMVEYIQGGVELVSWNGKVWQVYVKDCGYVEVGTQFCCLTREQAEEWIKRNVEETNA